MQKNKIEQEKTIRIKIFFFLVYLCYINNY